MRIIEFENTLLYKWVQQRLVNSSLQIHAFLIQARKSFIELTPCRTVESSWGRGWGRTEAALLQNLLVLILDLEAVEAGGWLEPGLVAVLRRRVRWPGPQTSDVTRRNCIWKQRRNISVSLKTSHGVLSAYRRTAALAAVDHLVKDPKLRSLKECSNWANGSSFPGHSIGAREKMLATPSVGALGKAHVNRNKCAQWASSKKENCCLGTS